MQMPRFHAVPSCSRSGDGESRPRAAQAPSAAAGARRQTEIWWLPEQEMQGLLTATSQPTSTPLLCSKQRLSQYLWAPAPLVPISISLTCASPRHSIPTSLSLPQDCAALGLPVLRKFVIIKRSSPGKRREGKMASPLRTELLNHSNPTG